MCAGRQVERDSGARIAVVNQHHADQLDLTLTPLAFLKSKFPGDGSYAHEQTLRSHLAGCGLPHLLPALVHRVLSRSADSSARHAEPATGHRPCRCGVDNLLQNSPGHALSGGQRSRVALSAVSFARPHILVMDEVNTRNLL